MKNSFIVLTAMAFTLLSFRTPLRNRDAKLAAEKTGIQVIEALKHETASEYVALFPNLVDFHTIMGMNSACYGDNLDGAKRDFAMQFDALDREVYNAFQEVIIEGKYQGIDWKTIKFLSAALEAEPTKSIDAATLKITFTANEKQYTVRIARAMWIRGEFKVSQFLAFDA